MNKKVGLNLIEIIRNVLHNETPSDYENYEEIYRLAKFHQVDCITYLGIKDKKEVTLYKDWKKAYDAASIRNVYFEAEREIILQEMKKHDLSYMPLKGINLLSCYQDYGMRMMSDNDILYGFVEERNQCLYLNKNREKEAQNIMVNIMKSLDYDVYSLKGKDDVFQKKPFYNFEMHRRLTERGHMHYDYYINPFQYAVRDDVDHNLFRLSVEEEYIYIIEHAFKHYEFAGVGIRYLIDMYVYLRMYKDKMNFEYISKQIKKLKMEDFYDKSYKLCFNAFDYEMDEDDKKFLDFLLSCGIYGTDKQQMDNRMKGNNKFTYLLKRLYPITEDYQDQYPIFYKYKILFPFLPIYRLTLALIKSPNRIFTEIKRLIRK